MCLVVFAEVYLSTLLPTLSMGIVSNEDFNSLLNCCNCSKWNSIAATNVFNDTGSADLKLYSNCYFTVPLLPFESFPPNHYLHHKSYSLNAS